MWRLSWALTYPSFAALRSILWLTVVASVAARPRGGQEAREQDDRLHPTAVLSPGFSINVLNIVPYEDHAAITFSYPVPSVNAAPEKCPRNAICNWEHQLSQVAGSVQQKLGDVPDQPALTHQAARRRKRGLWSLAALAVPTLVENFPRLLRLFNLGGTQLPEPEKALVRYNQEITASATDLPQKVAKTFQDFLEQRRQASKTGQLSVYSDINMKMLALLKLNILDQASAKCERGYLSPRLVKKQHLQEALRMVSEKIASSNAELLIPENDTSSYYDVKSATCTSNYESMFLTLRVPIREKDSTAKLYSLTPIPFKKGNLACYFLKQEMQVAMVGSRSYFLPPKYCENGVFFCNLPRDSNPSESGSCVIPLFKDLTSDEMCEPVCSTLTTPIVTQISEFEFHVLTADKHPLLIKCPRTQPLAISNIELGSDLINLPCECAMSYDKMTIVHPRLLCDEGTSHWTVKRAVPFAW